jgi:hypothetical protein
MALPRHTPLLRFMLERHRIYLARMTGGAAPWTNDPILQKYKFTNVYRELDRVTVWVRENIREPHADHPHLWFMLCIARQINWPPTLRALMDAPGEAWPDEYGDWDWRKAMKVMRGLAAKGHKVYTGAYMLTANGGGLLNKVPGKFDKPELTCKLVLNGVWKARNELAPLLGTTMEGAVAALNGKHVGFGGFMAYEVVCDLRHTRYLRNAPDTRTWAHAGPGAKRGLNRLLGRGAKERPFLSSAAAVGAMRHLLWKIEPDWPYEPRLELREIEHSLCEYDKYARAKNEEGRPRSYFTPSKEGVW